MQTIEQERYKNRIGMAKNAKRIKPKLAQKSIDSFTDAVVHL